ncbi:carboxypeptidase-like regulatory domain-containing protein [Fulvivirga maritima]|uniref:TonB-dependent receptor n=1 Tax=Fulvivirga maritima TaxID=2904247 RepID=UPI001F165A73|nr:TonB-dependent receptor [Fulvivirga maritima]UII27985.1 carboxypeptidase-like regulatory domain-containing protein [Fulvivirga maritima]
MYNSIIKKFLLLITISLLFLPLCSAQNSGNVNRITINPSYNGTKVVDALKAIESEYSVNILYNEETIQGFTLTGITKPFKLITFLRLLLVGYSVIPVENNTLLILEEKYEKDVPEINASYILLKINSKKLIKGTVFDGETNAPIIGAYVQLPMEDKGTITDTDGNFTIKTTNKVNLLQIKYIGYSTKNMLVGISSTSSKTEEEFYLFESYTELSGVEITAERQDRNVTEQITGIEKMGVESIKSLPTFLGEVDPLKSLTTLPGISSAGDVTAGINVRGGETGQNLIHQDGALIYNPTHLFGFFSGFNPDMVNNVTLYKGGGPASQGGRVSSILNIGLRNGNEDKHIIKGGLGIISSRLMIEGPIKKGRTSYMLGGRISYSNWLINSVQNIQLENSAANFHDVTGKIFHKIDNKNYITLSGYYSYDDFQLAKDSIFNWNTKNLSLKWDHTKNENLSTSLTVSGSRYHTIVDNTEATAMSTSKNGINTYRAAYDINFNQKGRNHHQIGIGTTASEINPGQLMASHNSNVQEIKLRKQRLLEPYIYGEGNFNLGLKWSFNAGIRITSAFRFGDDLIYNFNQESLDGRSPHITDTTQYNKGELMFSDINIEPRISFRYLLSKSTSLKASYFRTHQYMHLVSNTTIPMPTDYWIASSDNLKPQRGDQLSFGIFQNINHSEYEISAEGYYKIIDNTIDYIEGANLTLNQAIETNLLQGKGRAYGLEFQVKKNTGKFDGWISYTYSRSEKKFNPSNPELEINNGNYYPSIYDQPHNLSIILNYHFSERTTLSSNFQYSTGRPITIPTSKFSYGPYLSVLNYSERNAYRMPNYHRLDLSLTIKDRNYKDRFITGEWVISIYNLYGRKNAYSIYFNTTGLAHKLSILGSMFPSISYNFKI